MKKLYAQYPAIFLFLLFFSQFSFATTPSGWTSKFEPQKVFIENRGQFKINEPSGFDSKVKYAFDGGTEKFYFTGSGVVLELLDIKKPKESEKEEREMKERMKKGMTPEEHARMEREERHMIITKDELSAQWMGADPNVEIIAGSKVGPYYSYSFRNDKGEMVNENEIPAFEKLTYKNLYPNIDVVYELHPDGGIKYSVIVHPGGDISQVKLQYSKKAHLLSDGDIKTKSRFGDFIDHAPATFYQDDNVSVSSSYKLDHDLISFSVGNYDHTKTLVIDPWTQTPNFAGSGGWQCVWECQKDAANNVYVIGGVSEEELIKYNSTGTLQWTYVTPYDTANYWLGTFAVDNAGNSYVTGGSPAAMVKVNTAATVQWNNGNPGGIFSLTEWWDISFNCDQTQLVVGGTGGSGFGGPLPYIYNIDMSNGNVLNSVQITGSGGLFPPFEETRAITACGNGNYYFLTHDSIGYIHQGLTSCLPPGSVYPFHVNNSYGLGYKCEDFRAANTGIKAIKAFGGFVFTHRGNQVHKRLFSTGGIIGTATIPNGVWNVSGLGGNYVSNSGIDIDSCGNVYVGSINEVVKYDINLNQIATYPTSSNFNVYDVQVSPNGNIIAAGSTGNENSGARTGYVETFAAGACAAIAIVCCDATICPVPPVCSTASPFTLTAATAGGIWSGTGITNTSNGTFSPSVSGVGTFTVYYTLPCGRDSQTVTVNNCATMTVCRNASGTLTVSGGTAPYTWSEWDSTGRTCVGGIVFLGICTGTWEATYGWTQFATGTTVTVPAGIDTIKVSDGGSSDTIYNPATVALCVTCNLTVTPGTPTNVNCFGASTGIGRVTVTGGTSPFTYTWSAGGSTADSATGLAAGTYTVTVHDAGGCTGTATVTITQPASAVSATSTTVSTGCTGNTGRVVFTTAGGTPGYTYVWSPNVSTVDSATGLAAGTYHVTITDNKGCTFTTSATVGTTAGITVSPGAQINVNCFGASTGIAHVTVTGGTTPYTYTWSPNVSTVDSATGLAAGTYTVTVHDAGGCTGTATFTITQPATAVSATHTTVSTTCGNSNGRVIITAAGGTPGYTYIWSPNVSTVDSAINLAVGTYNVTVTDSKGCTFATSASVNSSSGFSVSPGVQRNVLCFGGNTGAAYVTVTGGTTPYTYTWSPNVSTLDSAVNLTAGTYTVTVHDAGGCSGTSSFTITQSASAVSATNTTVPDACGNNTGKVHITSSGGTPGYTYIWSPNVSTNDSAINLVNGTYLVTVTDANHCTATVSATVGVVAGPTASLGSQQNVSCNGGTNGKIIVTVTGGTGPFTYIWSPNVSTTDSAINLAQGTYTVTVKDANNCTSLLSETITQPTPFVITNVVTPASCGNSNGKVVFNVSGATPGYTYTWSPNVSTIDSAINLAAGTYSVTVKDANNCIAVSSATVIATAGVTASLASQKNVLCFGGNTGSANITASGGVTPYTYTWSPNVSTVDSAINLTAGTYTVTVKDANNCTGFVTVTITQPASALSATQTTSPAYCGNNNGKVYITPSGGTAGYTYIWSPNVSVNDSAINLASGTYLVTVTDANQCTAAISATVMPVAGPTVSLVSEQDVSCNGGSNGKIFVTVSGGVGPFVYTWSPSVSTNDSAVGLSQGNYSVTVKDANNCTSSLPVTVNQPGPISVSTTTVQAHCGVSDGSATAIVTGGINPLSYQWSVGTSTTAVDSGLAAGSYTVIVTDSNHCTAVGTAAISNIGAPTATIASQINVSCNGGNTGKIVLNITGGTQPYGYTWSPNVSTADSAVSLTAGTYNVTVNDASSCIAVVSATITQPQALSASVQSVNADCGQSDGWAKITVNGGTGSYTYAWSVPQNTDSITGLSGGTYYVTVTDSLGCTFVDSIVVGTNNGPAAPTITAGGPQIFCQGGSVTLTSSATTGNTWSTGATTQSITVTTNGTYTVTQTVGSCTSGPSASVTVVVNPIPPAPTITASGPLSFCQGSSVTLTSSAVSGNLWSDNETTQSIVVNAAGTYTVSDTQAGCPSPASAPVTVSIITAPSIVINASQQSLCPGSGSDTLDATTASATSYLWSTSSTQSSITITAPGTYMVTVTVNGCVGYDSITINSQPLLGTLSLPDSFSVCPGDPVMVDATTLNATSYVWTGEINATTPVITADSEGVYYVKVSNSCGSLNASTIVSFKDCDCRIVVPNAFTPNDDGRNDYFLPDYDCANPKYLLMRIFNRWGEKIFESTDLNGQWDGRYKGTMQPPGVYVYYIEFVGEENNTEKSFKLMGSLTLIR